MKCNLLVYLSGREIIYPLLLLVFPLIIYANTFQAAFHFDDHVYILGAPGIDDLLGSFLSLWHNLFTPDRRLVALTFSVNHAIHRFDLPGYHLVNILIHGMNGCLLLLILQLMLRRGAHGQTDHPFALISSVAFSTSLVFLAHPLAVNSVTYLSQRHSLLATTFYLAGFLCYLLSLWKNDWWAAWLLRGLCVFCFWGAIHCKPMALTLPLVVLAYEVIRAMTVKDQKKNSLPRLITLFLILALFFLIAGIFALDAGLFSRNEAVAGFYASNLWTPWVHFLTESKVFTHYLKLILLPLPQWLCVDHAYPLTRTIDGAVLLAWGIHGFVFAAGFWAYRNGLKITAFGITWFYLSIVPPYLLLPIADVMVEYKTYLPSIGIYMALAEVVYVLSQRWGGRKIAVILLAVALAASVGTIMRNRIFATEITFWTDSIRKYPSAPRPYNNRGLAWHARGDYSKAIADFERVLQLDPANLLVYANLGDSYKARGNLTSAVHCYREYIRRQPNKADGYVRLGNVMAMQNDWHGAVGQFQQAVGLEPKNQDALYNLGLGLGHVSKEREMVLAFKKIIKLNPHHFKAWSGLGVFHYANGDRDKAIRSFTRALQIEPQFADALFNLAVCYLETGDQLNALNLAERLLKIDPKRGALLKEYLQKAGVNDRSVEQ